MAILGTRHLGYSGEYATIEYNSSNQVAVAPPELETPAAGYAIRLGAWIRRYPGHASANIWFGLALLNDAGEPDVLIARTDRLPVGSGGTDTSGLITWVNPLYGDIASAVRMLGAQRFALVAKVESGSVQIALTPDLTTVYRKTYLVDNAPPTNPFGATSAIEQTGLAMYMEFVENSPPTVSMVTPVDGAVLNTSAPTFTAEFEDANDSAPTLDRMSAYALEVRRVSDNALIWGGAAAVFAANQSERDTGLLSRVYSGPALQVSPVVYSVRAEVYDDSGASSGWSAARTFSLNAAGKVNVAFDGSPSGKVDALSTTIDWTGRWSHPNGLGANALQVQVYRNGLPFRLGVEVTQAVVGTAVEPGTFFTVQDTVAGIGLLPPGPYTYAIRGRSTDGVWGAFSDQKVFSINALPYKPTGLQPAAGSISTALPLAEYIIDDPDSDDVFGVDDDAELEIIRPNGVSFSAFSTNFDANRMMGWYQFTASDLNAYGVYQWRVRGRDTSAGVNGYGPWSDYATFEYLQGPTVTITNPVDAEVEITTVPVVTWTVSGGTQQSARVLIHNKDNPLPFKAQSIGGAETSFQIPVGWLSNNGAYDLVVESWVAGIKGVSLRREFSVVYTSPLPPTNVQATGVMERRDHPASPSSMLISWDMTQYPPGEFRGYVLRRRRVDQRPQDATVLRTLISPAQNRWRDYWAPSREVLIYGVSQLRQVGGELLESPVVEVSSELILQVPILCSAYDATTYRFPLMYLEDSYEGESTRPEASFVTWGSNNKKTYVTTPAENDSRIVRLSVTIKSDGRGTLYDHLDDWESLCKSGHPLYYRPERQREAMYCRIQSAKWNRDGVGERQIHMVLEEIDFTPGERGGS